MQTCWRIVGSMPAEMSTASLELPEVDAAAPKSVSAAIAAVNAGQQECATALCRSGTWPAGMPSVSADRSVRLKLAGGCCCEMVPSCAVLCRSVPLAHVRAAARVECTSKETCLRISAYCGPKEPRLPQLHLL